MNDDNGRKSRWAGWAVAAAVGIALLWQLGKKPDSLPTPSSPISKENQPQPHDPRVDYDKFSVPELLVEARAAGLDPKVNKQWHLQIQSGAGFLELARALFRREDEIISLLDPDALLTRELIGTWKELPEPGKSC